MKYLSHKHRVNGFTLTEVLVVLALTSVSITVSFSALNLTQRLFTEYKSQNRFLLEFTNLKQICAREALHAKRIIETGSNSFAMERDSLSLQMKIEPEHVLLFKNQHCDTFHFKAQNIVLVYEKMSSPEWQNRLVKELSFDVFFGKQSYTFSFLKPHDASVKLALEIKE